MEDVYGGEAACGARLQKKRTGCANKAYFRSAERGLLCGVHARSCDDARALLPNPDKGRAVRAKLARDRVAVEDAARANERAHRRGDLICSKLRMMRAPDDHPGYMKVFPNNRHGGRADGYGCPGLSPMRMGPVVHGQPGLPPALNLENLHQGNKVFPGEAGADGAPTAGWASTQRELYTSAEPQRHKAAAKTAAGRHKNAPLYSVWRLPDGTPKRFTYIESRQFYCNFYERFALASPDFQALRDCLDAGYNLQIVGYDGRPVDRSLEAMYLDPTAPFGHELVLYALLSIEDPAQYPWHIHKTEDF